MYDKSKKAEVLLDFLTAEYGDAVCSLKHRNPFELIVATVLSAQCTDERVNKVTDDLFKKYPTSEKLAYADSDDILEIVRPTGFYKNKASNIMHIAKVVHEQYGGKLPLDMARLTALPGVGRKTANVVMGIFGRAEGIVVDTHVKRISGRLGLVSSDNPEKVEKELMPLIPEDKWSRFAHQMISFGREVCKARKPDCPECGVNEICDYYN